MSAQREPDSHVHDLLAVVLGGVAAFLLLSTSWEIDTSGPYPFYKGPLIYPLLVLSLAVLAALPSAWRLLQRPREAGWYLDGHGYPRKPLVVFTMLVGFAVLFMVVGLSVASLAFLFGALHFLGHRRPAVLVGVPVLVTVLVALVFKVFLDVWFPTPLLLDYLLYG